MGRQERSDIYNPVSVLSELNTSKLDWCRCRWCANRSHTGGL